MPEFTFGTMVTLSGLKEHGAMYNGLTGVVVDTVYQSNTLRIKIALPDGKVIAAKPCHLTGPPERPVAAPPGAAPHAATAKPPTTPACAPACPPQSNEACAEVVVEDGPAPTFPNEQGTVFTGKVSLETMADYCGVSWRVLLGEFGAGVPSTIVRKVNPDDPASLWELAPLGVIRAACGMELWLWDRSTPVVPLSEFVTDTRPEAVKNPSHWTKWTMMKD